LEIFERLPSAVLPRSVRPPHSHDRYCTVVQYCTVVGRCDIFGWTLSGRNPAIMEMESGEVSHDSDDCLEIPSDQIQQQWRWQDLIE